MINLTKCLLFIGALSFGTVAHAQVTSVQALSGSALQEELDNTTPLLDAEELESQLLQYEGDAELYLAKGGHGGGGHGGRGGGRGAPIWPRHGGGSGGGRHIGGGGGHYNGGGHLDRGHGGRDWKKGRHDHNGGWNGGHHNGGGHNNGHHDGHWNGGHKKHRHGGYHNGSRYWRNGAYWYWWNGNWYDYPYYGDYGYTRTCFARNGAGVLFRAISANVSVSYLQQRALDKCRLNSARPRSCYAAGCRVN